VTTLAVFGSATAAGAYRRDAWSDVDFAVFTDPAAAEAVSADWAFLPRPEDLVLVAREYDSAGAALYADGTLAEFGAGVPWEVTDHTYEILLGGGDLHVGPAPVEPDPANAIRLFLVKLLVGVGRVRRGEVLAGGQHIRGQALSALAATLRQRVPPEVDTEPNPFDPLRRFDISYPELGRRLAAAVDRPADAAGLALFEIAREVLEPGWPEFPTRAAEVIARKLGWV